MPSKKLMYLSILITLINLTGCQSTTSSNKAQTVESLINEEISQAHAAKDFRVYATSGRNMAIPGISLEDREVAKNICGIKYKTGTGDVLKTSEQRNSRKEILHYISLYNQRIFEMCKRSVK